MVRDTKETLSPKYDAHVITRLVSGTQEEGNIHQVTLSGSRTG
jgi:hypothetical protein